MVPKTRIRRNGRDIGQRRLAIRTSLMGDFNDFHTTTDARADGLLARTGSLRGHPSKQQPRSTMLHYVVLR
ncbi:hypothetical protein J6590_081037 [Homalodisca vitripennis]|nr:hypothetical protein J6590_081037 [Homalodisca vitripennis]